MPTVLWIWDISQLTCSMLVQQQNKIKQVAWHPKRPDVLAMTCETEYVYFVYPADRQVVPIKAPTGTLPRAFPFEYVRRGRGHAVLEPLCGSATQKTKKKKKSF